jgi:hypothetical protein
MLIALVKIAAGRIGLPDFDECVWDGTAVVVEYLACDDDPLS